MNMEDAVKTIIEHYGKEAQMKMVVGELGELLACFGKMAQGRDSKTMWKDEIADSYIMLMQLLNMVGLTKAEVQTEINFKVNRTLKRIEYSKAERHKSEKLSQLIVK